VVPAFGDVLALPERPRAIAVDIPIGLPDIAIAGGRACDRLARSLLGARTSSVFSPPSRRALNAFARKRDYRTVSNANASGRDGPRLSLQSYGILPKIAEVDAVMTPARQRSVREAHPELCFAQAHAGRPMKAAKKQPAGRTQRLAVLRTLGFPDPFALFGSPRPRGVAPDDILDACITCWTAERIARSLAVAVPSSAPVDARGLRMEIVW
jgi:predicted RNase H-like nuclease